MLKTKSIPAILITASLCLPSADTHAGGLGLDLVFVGTKATSNGTNDLTKLSIDACYHYLATTNCPDFIALSFISGGLPVVAITLLSVVFYAPISSSNHTTQFIIDYDFEDQPNNRKKEEARTELNNLKQLAGLAQSDAKEMLLNNNAESHLVSELIEQSYAFVASYGTEADVAAIQQIPRETLVQLLAVR